MASFNVGLGSRCGTKRLSSIVCEIASLVCCSWLCWSWACCSWAGAFPVATFSHSDDDEVVAMIVDLLTGTDAELRTLALEQVRDDLPGQQATLRFAALLPDLAPEVQTRLLIALGSRKDPSAREHVIRAFQDSANEDVRVAAVRALGEIGAADDFELLTAALMAESAELRTAATGSLTSLQGDGIADQFRRGIRGEGNPELRVHLIQIATQRRAVDVVPELFQVSLKEQGQLREAALEAVGQLANPDFIEDLIPAVTKAKAGAQREAAERAILAIYNRHPGLNQQPRHPVLAGFYKLVGDEQAALLPTVGRVGGKEAREVVDWYLKHPYPMVRDVGWRALCHWPDASVAAELLSAVEKPFDNARRSMAFKALVRVAGLQSETVSDSQRLEWLKKAMSLAKDDQERLLVLKRVSAVRNIDSLRFAIPWLDKPELADQACQTVVELAHLRWLRDEHKDEFMVALDHVQATSRDPVVLDRAQRYKEGKTWTGSNL